MTTSNTTDKISQVQERFVFPDPPEYKEDQMFNFDNLARNGNAHNLIFHLGNPETTLVVGERYLALEPTRSLAGVRHPDLLVAFGVSPEDYKASNAYVISEQGKPPDFVLEIAGPITGHIDVTDKRRDYAALGIPEYWRFDDTGEFHGARLAGDRLVGGRLVEGRLVGAEYVAKQIAELHGGSLDGYSAALGLHLRWEGGELRFIDPASIRRIANLADESARADAAEARADAAEARADAAKEERVRAEVRAREMEEQMRRQNP